MPYIEEKQTQNIESSPPESLIQRLEGTSVKQGIGLNLGYNINLNLPATSDPAVFNAIFRALKEHLLQSTNE